MPIYDHNPDITFAENCKVKIILPNQLHSSFITLYLFIKEELYAKKSDR
ncbi:MAG: hypothetical protein ACRC06_15395 [Waterburya sp.]